MLLHDLARMDAPGLVIVILFTLVPPSVMLLQARRAGSRDLVGEWADAHQLRVPDEYAAAVSRHLRRMVWLRGYGAAAGWITGSMLNPWLPGGPLGGVLLGYVVAAVAGEVTAQRHLGSGVASLAPRRLDAYVPGAAIGACRAVAALAAVIGALPILVSRHPSFLAARHLTMPALAAAGVLLLALGGEWLARRVVARRQTVGTPELLAVDDALRSTSAHLLVASVLAAELLGLGLTVAATATVVASPALRWSGAALGMGAVAAAIAALHLVAGRPWRVRRELVGAAG